MTVRTLIKVPRTARRGEVIEISTIIGHPMESGFRPGAGGQRLPRNIIERLINRLKNFRRIATRYEKRAVNYLAMITLGAILLWI